jgi:chloride channel 7
MALLNGNDIAGLLTPMVFAVKLVGTALSRMACLALGPEAPLVHLGACVASIVFYSGQRALY